MATKDRLRALQSAGYRVFSSDGHKLDLRDTNERMADTIAAAAAEIGQTLKAALAEVSSKLSKEPPVVHVAPPMVTVEAPKVTVNIERPNAWLFSVEKRDENGNIEAVRATALKQ